MRHPLSPESAHLWYCDHKAHEEGRRDLQRGKFVHYFLLLLQKKVIKEKESGKENRVCFSPVAQCLFPLQKTEPGSHLFRVSPLSYKLHNFTKNRSRVNIPGPFPESALLWR